jgi:hypothetical protein
LPAGSVRPMLQLGTAGRFRLCARFGLRQIKDMARDSAPELGANRRGRRRRAWSV